MDLKCLLTNQLFSVSSQKNRCLYCRWNVPGTFSCRLAFNFGGQANVTLSRCLVRRANHVDFACDTFQYPSINDITREDHGWYKER